MNINFTLSADYRLAYTSYEDISNGENINIEKVTISPETSSVRVAADYVGSIQLDELSNDNFNLSLTEPEIIKATQNYFNRKNIN